MSFFVDVVSEDSFYENLTLGVTQLLEANPCVRDVKLERRGACERAAISAWEQKHCCLLTEDLRNFYTSTDGLLITWSLEIAGEEFPIGRMEMRELGSLKRHLGGGGGGAASKEQQTEPTAGKSSPPEDTPAAPSSRAEPTFGDSRCKLFELAECANCRVFLVFQLQPEQDEPTVWLHRASNNRWYPVADSFIKYFRMMLVHLGLPQWQVCAAGLQLPTWLEQVYLLVGPHLLPSTQPRPAPSVSAESSLWCDGPTNLIDPAIFRGKEHQHGAARQKATGATAAAAPSANARKKSSSH